MSNLIPFNLDDATNGHHVATRNGYAITDICIANKSTDEFCVMATDERGITKRYTRSGAWKRHKTNYDLFMTGRSDGSARPIGSPTYTQAMANHNILPKVGVWVMVQGYAYKGSDLDWFKVEVLGHYEGKVIAESCSEANRVQLFDKFKPIDTRTGEEKAFDKFLDDKYNSKIAEFQSSQADRDFIEGLQLAFNSGVTFTGE